MSDKRWKAAGRVYIRLLRRQWCHSCPQKGDRRYLFVLNYGKQEEKITFYQDVKDLYTGQIISGSHMIDGYGTLVVEI